MKSIVQKLDLDGYLRLFEKFFARLKPVVMEGDAGYHYRYIKALMSLQFPDPGHVPNLDEELNRIKKQAVLREEEIYAFVMMISYFNSLKALELHEPLLSWIQEIEIPPEIMEVTGYFSDEGVISSQIDPELLGIETAIKINKSAIKEELYRLLHSNVLRDFLVDTQIHYLNSEETILVRGGFNNVLKATIVGRSSGGYFYVIPQKISALKEKESELLSAKEEVVYRYCQKISAVFHTWGRFLMFINKEYDRFDHYQARVNFARSYDYEFVLPAKHKRVKLVDFCHPAIEAPIPVSIDLNRPVMLITGVNAGGKTMLLKSILSAVYMSRHLLPFRCDARRTQIGSFRQIEAVIDDPQSVKNDISTFAGRMVEFAELFAKKDAIVGVDEIELGTDSDEAASLFRVMLEELRKREITFVVTTHHKRLASLMGSDENVELIAALYDEERRTPTYTFLQGSIGKSYAFETAQRYGIPEEIVAKAKVLYGEDKENLNELIEKSTAMEREMRQKIIALDDASQALERKKTALEEKEEQMRESYRKAAATMEEQYYSAIARAQEALKVQESTEGRRLLNEAHKLKEQPLPASEQESKTAFKVGDRIKYRSHKGELLSLGGNDATVMIEGMKMRVPQSQLKRCGDSRTVSAKPKEAKVEIEKGTAAVSVKLLGMYGDEAIEKVDKFLSDALVNGLGEVQIVHGTGGGVLSKLVTEYLQNYPKIKRFYRMPGNLGVTIVEL